MSDPQDLLYTNQFLSTNILSDKQLVQETEYYDRFKNYIDNGITDETDKYINENEYETSPININKTLDKPWPVTNNKNHYPLFDSYIRDISTNRYKKEIITKVNIDSRNRNISKYLNPNSFSIPFSKIFNNIQKFVINDIIFPNISQSITNINNNLAWQYASENYLIENNIDNSIIPTPVPNQKPISYSSLPNSVYSYKTTVGAANVANIDDYLVYQTSITPGFYTVDNLINNIKLETSLVLHGESETDLIKNVIEQPYLAYTKRIGSPHLFSCDIDPISSVVRFVNRINEVNIFALQTFSPYETNFQDNDIFYLFSSLSSGGTASYTLDTSYIYLTVPAINDITYQYYYNVNCIYTSNAFPLVITDLKTNIGNIDSSLINFTEFYDLNIYLNNGYEESELNSISHYKFIDTITLTNSTGSTTYLRFALRLSTGNVNGNNYNAKGKIIIPCVTDNVVFSNLLNEFLVAYNDTVTEQSGVVYNYNSTLPVPPILPTNTTFNATKYNTSGVLCDYRYVTNTPLVGSAILFRWIFDKKNSKYINYEYDTNNEKKRSLLHILAWPIANETDQIYTLDINNGFKFIHTNYQADLINNAELNNFSIQKTTNIPNINLNLQYFSNNYYFVNNSYIYLKIYFNNSETTNSDSQYINSVSDFDSQYNQVYVDSRLFNVGIGEDYTSIQNCRNITIYKKNQTGIFTKIILSNTPGNTDTILSNIINNNSYFVNYDTMENNINSVSIQLYDAQMRLLSISNNYSFSLTVHEVIDVLKETLVNSKTNGVTTTGNFI